MIKLQTKVEFSKPHFNINYKDQILFLGSCFSTNIGNRINRLKFKAIINPFGVLYNPASIAQNIDLLINQKKIEEANLNFFNDQWFSYNFDTSFSSPDKNTCLKNINDKFIYASKKITSVNHLFITLGTSWIYKNNESGKVVANCHKIPAIKFERLFMEPEEIVNILENSINKLLGINKNLNIVITISPIRHWKDGAIENMRSKASLIIAIKQLEKIFPNLFYFPVYEIFMDELRDYRFYASDMLHPNEFSIDYIWEIFSNSFFSENTKNTINKVDKLVRSFEHKIIHKETPENQKFINNLKIKTLDFIKKNPDIDFKNELNSLE